METALHTMRAGDLAAEFRPGQGMLCSSLRHRGEELLRRVDDLEAAARAGRTAGLPLLYPWANRLDRSRFAVLGRAVVLERTSPLVRIDADGSPIHGVPWSRLDWTVLEAGDGKISARLDWDTPALLEVFPFAHSVLMEGALDEDGLTLAVVVSADRGSPVPVCFGFHPYIGLPGVPRASWRLCLPDMQALVLDEGGMSVGEREPFPAYEGPLADLAFDHGFALAGTRVAMAVSGGGRRVAVEFLEGFPYAQIYAPAGEACIAFEPMAAPTGALVSGDDLRVVQPGSSYRAAFRISVRSEDATRLH